MNPLSDLDDWEDDLLRRYPQSTKKKSEFRNYDAGVAVGVREFYRLNHRNQTYDFVQQKRAEYLSLNKRKMGIWEAMEFRFTRRIVKANMST